MERIKQLNIIHGVAFDLEGTIINLEPLHHAAHLKAAEDIGLFLNIDEAIKLFPHFIGGPDENVAEEIAFYSKMNVTSEEILNNKRKYFEEFLLLYEAIIPRDGFADFIYWTQKRKIKIAIGSVTNNNQVQYLLKRSNLLSVFTKNQIVTREDVKYPKPNPEVYLVTAARIGINPLNQLVFEDSVIGVRSACAAGCRVVALPTVLTQSFKEALMGEGAEAVFETWRDPSLKMLVSNSLL